MQEYRIDDLARESGVSVRNIRVYQDRGLLPPPRRVGRSGWYSESHLARLRLIARMLERGYTFATIGELLAAARYGLRVQDLLETRDMDERWGHIDTSTVFTVNELQTLLGAGGSPDESVRRAVDLGALVPAGPGDHEGPGEDGSDGYSVRSPQLMQAALLLMEVGVPFETLLDLADGVREDLRDVARRFVGIVADRYLGAQSEAGAAGSGLELEPEQVSELAVLVNRLRPDANRVVQVMLAEAMEDEISRALDRAAEQLGLPPAAGD